MTTNILTGIISIVLGLVYSITALRLPRMAMGDRLGPKIFPYFVGIVTIITGIALILQDRNPEKRSKKAEFGFKEHKNLWLNIVILTIIGLYDSYCVVHLLSFNADKQRKVGTKHSDRRPFSRGDLLCIWGCT